MPIAEYSLVALDCANPMSLAQFYQSILGGEIESQTDDDTWVELRTETGAQIAFQQDRRHVRPGWPDGVPQQVHLDFDVSDLDEGEESVLGVGAVKAETQPRPDRWRVFIDPAGHPFCLVKAA